MKQPRKFELFLRSCLQWSVWFLVIGINAVLLICCEFNASGAQDRNGTIGTDAPMRCLTNDSRNEIDAIAKVYEKMWESANSRNANLPTPVDLLDFEIIFQDTQEPGKRAVLDSTQYAVDEVLLVRRLALASAPKVLSAFKNSRECTADVEVVFSDVRRLANLHEIAMFLCMYFLDNKEPEKAFEHLIQAIEISESLMQTDSMNAQLILTKTTARNLRAFVSVTSVCKPPPSVIARLQQHINNSIPNTERLRRAIALSSRDHLVELIEEYREQGKIIEASEIETLTAKSNEVQALFQYNFWGRDSFGPGVGFSDHGSYDIFDTRFENLEGQCIGGIISNYYTIAKDEQWRRICVAILAMMLDDLDVERNAAGPIAKYLECFKVGEQCVSEVVSDQERRFIVKTEPQGREWEMVRVVVVPRNHRDRP